MSKQRDEAKRYFFRTWDTVSMLKTSLLITFQNKPPHSPEEYFRAVGQLVQFADATADLVYEINEDLDKIERRLARLESPSVQPVKR